MVIKKPLPYYMNSLFTGMNYGAKYAPLAKALYNKYSKAAPMRVQNSRKKCPSRRPYRKRYNKRFSTKRDTKELKKQIRNVKRSAESDMGTLIFRDVECTTLRVSQNAQNSIVRNGVTVDELEEVLGQLRYYDPTAPTSLVVADGRTGTYNKEFLFKKCYTNLKVMNNYQVPVKVSIYLCQVKSDTSLSPLTTWSNGLADVSNGTVSSVNTYPTDSDQFVDLWSIIQTKKSILMPGQTMSMVHSLKPFNYDPSLYDSHSLNNLRIYKSYSYLIVLRGVVGHDSTLTEVGFLPGGVDMLLSRSFEVQYSAGANIRYLHVSDTFNNFTNGGVISNAPISDNQSYSVA